MNKTVAIVAAVGIIAIAGGAIYMNSSKPAPQPTDTNNAMTAEPTTAAMDETKPANSGETPEANETMVADDTAAVKEFTVTGSNFSFDPKEIKVKKGDKVRVTFKNQDGFHDFVIDEFNVKTKQIQGGAEETVEFTADKTGTFEYYCSVGKHRQMGMVGNLIVE